MSNTSIETLETDALTVLKTGDPGEHPSIILCHGFGADASDLVPLKDHIPVDTPQRSFGWIFPEAPISLRDFDIPGGRVWFPDTPEEIDAALSGAYFAKLPEQNPAGLQRAAELLLQTLSDLGCTLSQCFLGGFSQGSMVALEAALIAEEKPKALLIMSGALIARDHWRDLMRSSPRFPVFQSHGSMDPVLSPVHARELNKMLTEEGFFPRFYEFLGYHGIPDSVTKQIASFISSTS